MAQSLHVARDLAHWRGVWIAMMLLSVGMPPSFSAENDAALDREINALLRQLDADEFSIRQQAMARLEQLKSRPEALPALAESFHRAITSPDTPFEVRRQLERLASGLPRVDRDPGQAAAVEEIERLIAMLNHNQYGVRLGATRRLEWLLENPKWCGAIYAKLKQRLGDADLSLDARRWIEPVCAKARGAWLTSDPRQWRLPTVALPQIEAWIERLASPIPAGNVASAPRDRETALREIQDLLAREDYVAQVKQALEKRLARGNLDARATRDLTDLLDLCRPAMVAEFWQGRRHLNTQHLVIGVAKREGQADRPSHFDYVDDDTAFCVSGQNLSPGNHRVGIAFPHPKAFGAMFHLVNLSTPRQKMAYASLGRREARERLAEISRRTLDEWLAARQRPSLEELFLLEQLDPAEVSRFAGKHFLLVDDQAIPGDVVRSYVGRIAMPGPNALGVPLDSVLASRHGMICFRLAVEGVREAAPDLLLAIEKNRFLPPTLEAPYSLPWIAALAIASRDPWPGVDAWLAQLVEKTETLVMGRDGAPELGATAAGILFASRREEPLHFGLNAVADPLFDRAGLMGCRFAAADSRKRILQWWSAHQARPVP